MQVERQDFPKEHLFFPDPPISGVRLGAEWFLQLQNQIL